MSESIVVELCVQGEWTADGQLLAAARDEIKQLRAEVARLRLTDAEREAVDMAIDLLNGVEDVSAGASSRADAAAAMLRGLLERTK